MNKKCECGCEQVVNNRFVRGHSNRILTKGKTHKEIYDKEKVILLKNRNKRTWEEKYGIENSIKRRKNRAKWKGKNYEERFGKKKAKIIKDKIAKKMIISKNKIIDKTKKFFNENEPITKTQFINLIWNHETIREKFGSLNNLAKQANIRFAGPKFFSRYGKNETKILDKIEKNFSIKLERQYYIAGKYVDGYDKDNNIVYEVDENYHNHFKVQDIIREDKIKKELNCNFVRIKDFGAKNAY